MKTTKAKILANLVITLNDRKFVIYSFISNNDGTRGFRFNILNLLKGFTRFRRDWKKHQAPRKFIFKTENDLIDFNWNYPERMNLPKVQKAIEKLKIGNRNSYRQFHFSFITIAFEKRSNPIKLSRTFAKARS